MNRDYKFGLELEATDLDTSKGLPSGFHRWSTQEYDLVSSKHPYRGLPNDPRFGSKKRLHTIGGELNSEPTNNIQGQIQSLINFNDMYPEAELNHRIDTHTHISLPEFKTDLNLVKKVMKYVYNNSHFWLDRIYPDVEHPDMLRGDKQFVNTNSRLMPEWRYNQIMSSNNMDEFLLNHQRDTTGKYNPRLTVRYPFNFFAIKDHGSIECRVNRCTLDPVILESHFLALHNLVEEALSDNPRSFDIIIDQMEAEGHVWSVSPTYDHEIQCAWRYCSYPMVGNHMITRWKEFKRLWEEDKSRFFKEGWVHEPWAVFNKGDYE